MDFSQIVASLVLGLVTLILYYQDDAFWTVRLPKSLPRSSKIPVLGSMISVISNLDRIYDYIYEQTEIFNWNSFVVTSPFTSPWIITHKPEHVEHILKSKFIDYGKGPDFMENMQSVFGHGIFAVNGEKWKAIRKTAANIFTTKGFKIFVEKVFADTYVQLEKQLAILAETGQEFDIQDLFFRFTLDSFGMIGFGADIGSLNNGKAPFAAAFDRSQMVIFDRFMNPFWKISELFKSSQIARDVKIIKEFGQKLVEERRSENDESNFDLLTLLAKAVGPDGNPYTDEELVDHVLNFIIAGRDTTAIALSWTVYELFKNPECLKKLIEEIDQELGDERLPSYDQVRNLKYGKAAFLEALRLHPSVPGNIVYCFKDDTLPDGTFVPKGASVFYSPYVQGRSKEIWGEDALKFKPERWLSDKLPSQYEYTVFKAGPRICLGKTFAELEGVFVLASLLRNYELKNVKVDSVTYAPSLTLPIKDGLKCVLKKRL